MPLSPEWIEEQEHQNEVIALYEQLNIDLISEVISHMKSDVVNSFQQAQIETIIATGGQEMYENAIQLAASLSKAQKEALKNIYTQTCQEVMKDYKSIFDSKGKEYKVSKAQLQILNNAKKHTDQEIQNMSGSIALGVQKEYEDAMMRAYINVASGGMAAEKAIEIAAKDLAKNGVKVYTRSGKRYELEYIVRRNLHEGIQQTANTIATSVADELGCNGYEVSAHVGARPSHAAAQGKQYAITPEDAAKYGVGLWKDVQDLWSEWNCRHTYSGIILGISEPAYTAKELYDMENKQVFYNGQQIGIYQATQMQAKMERDMRQVRREIETLKAAGIDPSEAEAHLRALSKKYRDFCKQTALTPRPGRTMITGAASMKGSNAVNVDAVLQTQAIQAAKLAKQQAATTLEVDLTMYKPNTVNSSEKLYKQVFKQLPADMQKKVLHEIAMDQQYYIDPKTGKYKFKEAIEKTMAKEGLSLTIKKPTKNKPTATQTTATTAQNSPQAKPKATKAKKLTDEEQYKKNEKTIAKLQKEMLKYDNNKVYSGIWKGKDVTLDEYVDVKDSIDSKIAYYEGELKKETDPKKIAWLQSKLAAVQEYKTAGQAVYDLVNQLIPLENEQSKLEAALIKAGSSVVKQKPVAKDNSPVFTDDQYTQESKDNAYWCTGRNGSKKADKLLRKTCGEVWNNATDEEQSAIYEYTHSYSKINEPLRGYEYGTGKYLGVGKVDFSTIGMNYGGYKKGQVKRLIDHMTSIISKSKYNFDIWFNRGVGYNGMDKFFGVDLRYMTEEQAQSLVGTTPTEWGFMSCGTAKGKGFGGDIKLNVYCPAGTQMMYVEPFSAYGCGDGRNWDGISPQAIISNESEILLQQGTQFKVTKIYKTGGTWYVDMDVIGQKPQK